MKRKAQLWRFVDETGQPLLARLNSTGLHRLLASNNPDVVDPAFEDGFGYISQVDAIQGTDTQHFSIHRLRMDDLPSEVDGRKVRPLRGSVQGLAETTHVRLIERNLAIFMTSGYSPRPMRFADYLRARIGLDVWLKPVPREDLGQVLDQLRRVSRIDLAIAADEAARLDLSELYGDADPLAALNAAGRAQQGGIVRVGWSVGHDKHADQGALRRILDRIFHVDTSRFESATATVYVENSKEPVTVNFLHDNIVTQVDVGDPVSRSRELTAAQAHEALGDAERHFRDVEKYRTFIDPVDDRRLRLPPRLLDPVTPPGTESNA